MTGPLAGVRILDLTRLLPGNYCTMLLADLGADVVKVEEPGRGDYVRLTPPLVDGESAIHRAMNRGKRSITVDLKRPEGVAILKRLAAEADALIESFRPGVLDRLGAGPSALAEANPRLVVCAITGYGQDGPYRHRPGHDINYLGTAGVLDLTGPADGPPSLAGVQIADLAGGMSAAVGVLACLVEARAGGRGRFVDASLLDAAMSWQGVLVPTHLATGEVPRRGGTPLTGALACYRVYATGDGRFLTVGALEPQFWEALCTALEAPELIEDHLAPPDRQAEVAARLAEIFSAKPRDEWMDRLAGLEACVGPVLDLGEALADPQVRHRDLVVDVDGRPVGPRSPVRIEGVSPSTRPAPGLGEHTDAILGEAGVSGPEIEGLRRLGAV